MGSLHLPKRQLLHTAAELGWCCLQVVELPEYGAWIASFGESTRHIMVNSTAVPGAYPLTSSATLQVGVAYFGASSLAINLCEAC